MAFSGFYSLRGVRSTGAHQALWYMASTSTGLSDNDSVPSLWDLGGVEVLELSGATRFRNVSKMIKGTLFSFYFW